LAALAWSRQPVDAQGRPASRPGKVLTGKAAFGGFNADAPGVRRLIRPGDLPRPFETQSANNGPRLVVRPEGAWPRVPAGFVVQLYASGLNNPRAIMTAPNGDLFVAESGPGQIRVLRGANARGEAVSNAVYAEGLRLPFGMAFYPPGPKPTHLYVANTDSVVRFAYRNGDMKASGPPETVVPNLPGYGRLRGGGHWTRDIRFSRDGKTMFVSVGSLTNVWENPSANEERRAAILAFNPDGTRERIYASGIRNAVGLAVHPLTGQLWCSVNERDGLGDDLVPDYITRVKEGGFYGWPWYYIGPNEDPRHAGKRPELRSKVIVPEVLIQAHSASLCIEFYTGRMFPREYHHDAFAAEHGSWNRSLRTGYKVIRVPQKNGIPTGEYEDFMTGFVTPDGNVWGRPVGVTVGKDGALLVSDDGSGSIWRVVYTGKR
jgi:glucose/arabinose dehydrogenase